MASVVGPSNGFVTMSRPQVGIDRLPTRRASNEPREAMNCKSCRKRKIKCNRIKPSCEACQAFNCPCVYDAIPKKRGPKTDVLEALLKRVNGLERRLKDEKKPGSDDEAVVAEATPAEGASISQSSSEPADVGDAEMPTTAGVVPQTVPVRQTPVDDKQPEPLPRPRVAPRSQSYAATATAPHDPNAFTQALIDTYFARLHGKPYHILDEPATRQRWRDGQLPRYVINAIHAVSLRYASHLCGGHNNAIFASQDYLRQSRVEIDVDEPSIDHVQALLLLSMASFQNGKGKRSYMMLSHATNMALGLSLHRELPQHLRIAPSEREGRRKLFWTCYLMDRFTATGSKRPSIIPDESICLKLPAWQPAGSQLCMDGNFFPNGSSIPYATGVFNAGQGSGAMLVEIVRVLGITNRYLAAGGVKGDSHFPWHTQSTLSKIRTELDYWAANTLEAFGSLEGLFGQPDNSTLVLSKLVYHLIHCLIYRPFLPVDLAELSGTGQHQSWQIEATNLCFLHANAIAELVEIGKNTAIIDWPSFVGFCICTAGTIHVHGAHYMSLREGELFGNSAEFLSREMAQLADLRHIWAGVQHQRQTLQIVYASHSQLVKSLANNPMRYSPVFQMEDFFGRYPGAYIDGANVTFNDVVVDPVHESLSTYNGLQNTEEVWNNQFQNGANQQFPPVLPSQYMTQNTMPASARRTKKRRTTSTSLPYPTPQNDATNRVPLERQQSYERSVQAAQLQQQQHLNQPHPQTEQTDFALPTEQTKNNDLQTPTFTQSVFSPTFNFSPMAPELTLPPSDTGQSWGGAHHGFDHQTPSGLSVSAESAHTDPEKDPFLSYLEQLAENDGAGAAGMQDLDFFLNGQGGDQYVG